MGHSATRYPSKDNRRPSLILGDGGRAFCSKLNAHYVLRVVSARPREGMGQSYATQSRFHIPTPSKNLEKTTTDEKALLHSALSSVSLWSAHS